MAYAFTQSERDRMRKDLESNPLDLLVIGGGVTGAGILLDAHTRGIRSAVIEMQDFAAGTSSRSTKLVHGGLRYLKQLDIEVVAEVGEERAIVYENGPHVTTPLWMMLPIVEKGTYGMFMSAVGLFIYDRLAKVKPEERRTMLSATKALEIEPLLNPKGLKGAGYYVEYRTDDARLTLEIVKEAVARGAIALNYTKAEDLIYENGKVSGAKVKDLLTGETYNIYAKKVVNATGPWVDQLREKDHSKEGKTLHWTKGVHIVIDGERFPLHNPVYYDVPDGRMIFAIPRAGKTYVGTTDTNYHGDPQRPITTKADLNYLVDCINYMFPAVDLKPEEVESFWSGIRPLIHEEGKGPSEISRKDEIFTSPSQLITIAGGKLTGYRKMAEKVVTYVAELLEQDHASHYRSCQTEHIELSGGKFGGSAHFSSFIQEKTTEGIALGLTEDEANKLAHRYGTNVEELFEIIRNKGEQARSSELSLEVFASLDYGIHQEMVITPSDFFIRRTSAMFFDIHWVQKWKDLVVRYMANYFHWDEAHTNALKEELYRYIKEATMAMDEGGEGI